MKKIVIIGSGGSGKSTLSRELDEILKIPVYHLDKLHWKPGWVTTPEYEWDQLMEELVKRDKWIIDGNYNRTMGIRLREADTIIFLVFPTYLCLYRVLKRRYKYRGKTRPDMGEGCQERIDNQFLSWILQYRQNNRPGIIIQLDDLSEKNIYIYILKNRKEVKDFLKNLREGINKAHV